MPTFDDLRDCPVVHTQREDGVTLIATRVPLDDIRLEQWGWLLTLNRKDGRTVQDDIETLRDNTGRQYPKVYLLTDMKHYIERWACSEWEEGYQSNGNVTVSVKSCTPLGMDAVREDVFRQVLSEVQNHQYEQAIQLQNELKAYIEAINSEIGKNNTAFHDAWNEQVMEYFNRFLEHSRNNFEDTKKQLEVLDQEIATHLLQTHEAVIKVEEEIKKRSLLSQEDSEKYIRIISEEIKSQTMLGQKSTLEAIDTLLLPTQQDTQKMIASAHEEIKTVIVSFSGQMKNLQEQIKQVLAELDSEVEDEMGKTENPDTAPTATKMVRRVTTQIERIAANQQKMSMSYYNNANEQAKQGFKLAWMLSIIGAVLLGVTIISAVFMTSLHLYGYTALLPTVRSFFCQISLRSRMRLLSTR